MYLQPHLAQWQCPVALAVLYRSFRPKSLLSLHSGKVKIIIISPFKLCELAWYLFFSIFSDTSQEKGLENSMVQQTQITGSKKGMYTVHHV